MCSKKSTKIEESNKKRLESLNERLNEFQLKKKLVRLSLHDLDSSNKPKKIIFDDDDDEENVPKTVNEDVEEPVKPKKAKKEKKEKKNSTLIEEVKEKPKPEISNGESKKKLKLMDSDSENEEDTLKMLDSKVNLDQKKANKLIYLKTKFSNDDQRFKIDERFAENDEDDDQDGLVKEEDEEEEDNKEDDDDEDARPKKSNKKQLKKEKLSALKILEEITAKPILKPTEEPESMEERKLLKRREMLKSKPIVRYDPTKEEHKKFEINEDKEKELSSSDDSDKEEESRKGDDDNEEVDEEKQPKIEEDTSKYFKVEPNLKDLFSSHDVFKFKFTQDESSESEKDEKDEEDEENEEEEPHRPINKIKPNLLLPTKRSKYSSSSSSESEYEGNDDEEYHEIENRKSQAKELSSSKQPTIRKSNLNEQNASFLPDFDKSKDILDALDYFMNRKDDESSDLEKFRNEWSSQREKLVEECKKKHKRMIRIKKAQENKKLLPWRTSNKSIIKRNKTKK